MKSLSSKKSSSRRRKIIIFVVILALIGVGVGAYYYPKIYKQEPTGGQQAAETDNSVKKEDTSETPSEGLPDNSSSVTSDQVEASPSLSVSIADASQSSGMVRASAKTSGSGTCVFLYEPSDGGKPVSKSTVVNGNACSFSASQNEFAYLGQWKLTVTYYNSGKKAEASQNVTIN